MRLVVTGASSFVGAWFCLAAQRRHEVIGLAHETSLSLPGVRTVRLNLGDSDAGAKLAALRPDTAGGHQPARRLPLPHRALRRSTPAVTNCSENKRRRLKPTSQ